MLPNVTLARLRKIVWRFYHRTENKVHGTPYVRARKRSYFAGQKIFLNFYLRQGEQRRVSEAVRRLRCFEAAIDLVINNTEKPVEVISNPGGKLLRFVGETRSGKRFCVQVLRSKRGSCYLMSSFPYK